MRLWSVHPKYLDAKGLVALWRESLLAKKVLEGNTKGYRNHPQLIRFRNSGNALDYINNYIAVIYQQSIDLGYHFTTGKFYSGTLPCLLKVNDDQVKFEVSHLLDKLVKRDRLKYLQLMNEDNIEVHPLFMVVHGPVEDWEILT